MILLPLRAEPCAAGKKRKLCAAEHVRVNPINMRAGISEIVSCKAKLVQFSVTISQR